VGWILAINVNGTTMPLNFYAYNIERVHSNPMSIIQNAKNVRIYYQKSEAGSNGTGLDTNTPIQILNSSNVRIYCVTGNMVDTNGRPMVDVVNSTDVLVSQAKSFTTTGTFPIIRETIGSTVFEITTTYMAALYIRNHAVTGVAIFNKFEPEVYPYPFNDDFTIEVPSGYISIDIFNTIGQRIFSQNAAEAKKININFLADKPTGIYFLRVNGKEAKKTFTLIKEK
jgi:hypothetical protein